MKIRALGATLAASALVLSATPVAQAQNAFLSSPGREVPNVNWELALDPNTYTNPTPIEREILPDNLVAFGDSIMANPTYGDAAMNQVTGEEVRDIVRTLNNNITPQGCAQGTPNTADEIGKNLGVPVNNYACPAATLYTLEKNSLAGQVAAAVADGALNESTRYVVIQGGYNDIYSNYLRPTGEEGASIPGDEGTATQRDLFADAIDSLIAQVRASAPNAKISLLGYHTITPDTPAGWQCIYHVGQGNGAANVWNLTYAVPVAQNTQGERNTQKWLSEAAQRNGITFADVREFSKDHTECTAPADRWVGGIILDTTSSGHNLALHLTDAGVYALSSEYARQIA
ncbi:MAG: GDSL-type esterase/lipase family protein [Corynebacterium sp.]|nr:GDSL-type esterase/lipase family protein [Corynebacterium sp.]